MKTFKQALIAALHNKPVDLAEFPDDEREILSPIISLVRVINGIGKTEAPTQAEAARDKLLDAAVDALDEDQLLELLAGAA